MTGFGNFLLVSVKTRKNELSSAQSPLKVIFAGFLIEQAPTLGCFSGYPAQRKQKNPRRLPA